METAAVPDATSVEPGEQAHAEVASEQTPPAEITHLPEAPSVDAETPPLSVDVPAEVSAVAAEQPLEVASDSAVIGEELAEERQQAAEHVPQPGDVEEATPTVDSVTSSGVTAPAIDDSASKPEVTAGSSVEVGDIEPEELPPPLTPENEAASAPAGDELEQSPATSSHETSDQPDEHAVHDAVDSVQEPMSESHSEPVDHTSYTPVTGEP